MMLFLLLVVPQIAVSLDLFKEDISVGTESNNLSTKSVEYSSSEWFSESLKDIAYYLRAHKFNEYDRRYEKTGITAPRTYFKEFPRPPLRSLHWEVHKHCEVSFGSCVRYLGKILKHATLKRADDTAVIMQEQDWKFPKNSEQIQQVERECVKMKKFDDQIADPFEGPLERYQWRVTAGYFMCRYTMQEVPELAHLGESCDNFAACLDPQFGASNRDPRANDAIPYSCAQYSFCPDRCCPFKHITHLENCWSMPDNPCHRNNPPGRRECSFNRPINTDFSDIVLNRWNVSCRCPHKGGFEWNSFYGMCIDVDECAGSGTLAQALHNCDRNSEACVNLVGGFRCACDWGNIWSAKERKCVPSATLALIKLFRRNETREDNNSTRRSLIRGLLSYFRKSGGSIPNFQSSSIFMCIIVLSLI